MASKAWFDKSGDSSSPATHSASPERRQLKGVLSGAGATATLRNSAGISAHDLHAHEGAKLKQQDYLLHEDYQKNVLGIAADGDGSTGHRFVLVSLGSKRVLRQLRGHDSQIIGAYTLDDMEYLVLASARFSFYFYSLASGTLERKANYAQAFVTLSIQERFADTLWRFRQHDIHDYLSFDRVVEHFKRSQHSRRKTSNFITAASGMEPKSTEAANDSGEEEFNHPGKKSSKPMGLPIQRDLLYLMTESFLPTQFNSFRLSSGTFQEEYNVAITVILDSIRQMKLQGYDPAQELRATQGLAPSERMLELFNRAQYIGNQLSSADIAEMRQDVMFVNTRLGQDRRQYNVMLVSVKQALKNLVHQGKFAQYDARSSQSTHQIRASFGHRSSTKKRRIVPLDQVVDTGFEQEKQSRGTGSLYLQSLKSNVKWPLSVFSLFHFFGASQELDEDLVKQMGYLPPTVAMCPGTSGVDRSFAFVIDQDEEAVVEEGVTLAKQNVSTWLTSSHATTLQSTAFLSSLTAIAEYHSQEFIAGLVDSWLEILFALFENGAPELSFPTLSKLVIRTDLNVSATARDLVLKPFLSKATLDAHLPAIRAWGNLLERSYQVVRKDPLFLELHLVPQKPGGFELIEDPRTASHLGELEFRALTSVAFFSLPHGAALHPRLIRRCANLILMLLRQMSGKLKTHAQYLVVLLQLLSSGLRIYNHIYTQILDGILLLIARLYHKVSASTPTEYKKTKISGDKFLLIKPENELNFLKITATKAMVEIGNVYPAEFIDFLQSQVANPEQQDFIHYTNAMLDILKVYVKRQPADTLEPYLVRLFQILLKCFEPSDQTLRKNTQVNVTQILRLFVERFPMVSFHQASQRIAIGTTQSLIAIYDLRTAQKWRVFEGHNAEITMLHFSDTGKYLASYSHSEKQLKIWKVGNTGFFSSIIGLQGRAQKSFDLSKEAEVAGLAKEAAKTMEMEFMGSKEAQIQVSLPPFFKKILKIK